MANTPAGAAGKTLLERKLGWYFFLISLLATMLSLGGTLYYDVTRQQKAIDGTISRAAAYVASMPGVSAMLADGFPDGDVISDLDAFAESMPDINVILVCDTEGLRFYHTDRHTSGDTVLEGDEDAILSGAAPYITTGYGTAGTQRRAFNAVTDAGGNITGYCMASIFSKSITDRIQAILLVHAVILAAVVLAGSFLSQVIIRSLRSSLMGFHPEELLNMYIRQDEVLNAVEEGMVATDGDGNILFANLRARRLLSGAERSLAGRPLRALFPETMWEEVIRSGEPVHNRSQEISGRNILVTEIPIKSGRRAPGGVLTLFMDRTETLRLSDELSGTRSMLDTLRAFNHEFLNKLHVILGYLQLGDTERAIKFITNSTLVTSQSIRHTADCIRVTSICALVIGKMMHAAELGILLTLSPDSICRDEELIIPPEDCVTIIGNLLENAIEELTLKPESEDREIHLSIHCRRDCNIFICEDTGGGISPELLDRIMEYGVSSKGENRGTGLYLIQNILTRCGGDISIDTEAGEGTCFTLTFTRKGD